MGDRYEHTNALDLLDRESASWLKSWSGRGERCGGRQGNNCGPMIQWWRSIDGTGGPVEVRGAWCAVVQCAADQWAAASLGLELPYQTSRSAKRYTKSVAEAGHWVAEPRGPWGIFGPRWMAELPKPGDRICWHRGDLSRADTRRRGHVARVVEYDAASDVITVREGNRNNRTDDRGRRYAVVGVRRIRNWRRRLYGIARLARE